MRLLKKIFYIPLILLLVFSCTKKNSNINSLNSSEDSLSVFLEKANDYNLKTSKREDYNQKAFALILDQEKDSIRQVNLFRVANRYYNLNNFEGYKKTIDVVLDQALKSKDSTNTAKADTYLGDFYRAKKISDSAYYYYFRAEKIYLKLNNSVDLAKTRLNKAILQYNESDLTGSEISVFNALRALNREKENNILYDAYNLLGIIYNDLGEYDKALEYHNKALVSIDEKTPIELQYTALSINNIGLVYQNSNRDRQAITYFEKALENKKDLMKYDPFNYSVVLDNLGYSRFKIGENKDLPDLFYKSLQLRDSLDSKSGIIGAKIHLSEYFAAKKDTTKALQYSNEALAEARSTKNARNLLLPLKQLSVIEPQKAVAYNKEYIRINDSLQKAERSMGEKFTRIEYETDEIKSENVSLTTQNRNIVYIFGSVLILMMFMYIIKVQKTKTRELLYKQEQQRANEEIYNLIISQQSSMDFVRIKEKNRVAQELHDAVLGRMFGVRMNLDTWNPIQDEEAVDKRKSFILELKIIEQDIREISHDLSREKSELINNFVAIVEELFENQKKTFKSELITRIDSTINWDKISNIVKINLYRIVQESFQNINKYANANFIVVEFRNEIENIVLEIRDDGVGFNVNKGKKGIGLQNMLSRIDECNGTFEIKSKLGEGTIIIASVPT